jgi:hypothetical protein
VTLKNNQRHSHTKFDRVWPCAQKKQYP